MTDQVTAFVTEEDFARFDAEDRWVEVVDGELVEVDRDIVTFFHVIIVDNIFLILTPFVRANKLGRVQTDGVRFILERQGRKIIRAHVPDLFFVRNERIPADYNWQSSFPSAPDFAVEIIAPGQSTADLLAKIAAYLRTGTEEAWLIFPSKHEIHQYRRDEQIPRVYQGDDTVDTSLLFPGLTLRVADVFKLDEE